MLELYHHGSSACAAKVRFALEEKELKWKGHYLDILAGDQFDSNYLKINPKAVVPTLVHDGKIVPESTLICEYVDEVFPNNPIYPADPYDKVQVRLWTKAVDEELHPACSAITYIASHRFTIIRQGAGEFEEFNDKKGDGASNARDSKAQWLKLGINAPGAADQVKLYLRYLDKMEEALRDSEWLVGNAFTMADIAMTPYVNRLSALSMHEIWQGRLPNVERWFNAIQKRPTFDEAFVKWVPKALKDEMATNGERSWPEIRDMVGLSAPNA